MLQKRQIVLGILFWVLVFGGLVTLSGPDNFVESLDRISLSELRWILVAVATGVVAMGSCLYVIGRNLDFGGSLVETIFLNTSVSLAHNLTPFGQAGGAPIGAAILSKRLDGDYEECLAALSMKDIVSFTPAILVFIFGGGYLALYEQSIPERVRPLIAAFSLFVIGIVVAVIAVRTYPTYVQRVLERLVFALNGIAKRLPFAPSLEPDEVNQRVASFSQSIGQIASDKPTVIVASALATTSFVAQGCLLYLTLNAIGIEISVALAVFIVPVSLLASGLPLPGGAGGVEAVQIAMIAATVGADLSAATPAVVLSRGLVFWTPIVLGSLTLLAIQVDNIRKARAKA
jgi:uncharacterized protein (TIRG00374 family)